MQHHDLARAAFTFIEACILPSLPDVRVGTRVSFEFSERPVVDVRVRPLGDTYVVRVTYLFLDELRKLVTQGGEQINPKLLHIRLGSGNIKSHKSVLSLVYFYAILFACLHEVSHLFGGHFGTLAWEKEARREFSSASSNASGTEGSSLKPEDLFKIRELQADGHAMEMLFEHCIEAVHAFAQARHSACRVEHITVAPRKEMKFRRLMLLAAFCCGLLLQKDHTSVENGYPLPEGRMANMAARFLFKRTLGVLQGQLTVRRGSIYISPKSASVPALDDGQIMAICEIILKEVVPPLRWAEVMASANHIGVALVLGSADLGDIGTQHWNFIRDLSRMAVGGAPGSTRWGEELTRLANLADLFEDVVQPHRLMRWN